MFAEFRIRLMDVELGHEYPGRLDERLICTEGHSYVRRGRRAAVSALTERLPLFYGL